jgi:cytochrome c553
MKVLTLNLMSRAALLAIFSAAAAHAGETETSTPLKKPAYSKEALQGKIEFCQTCHGISGEGARGGPLPIPRLAGQQTKYLENQLTNFMVRRRQNNVMSNVAHDLSPALITALAAYFNGLNPKPLGGAPAELTAAGKKIFEEGVPEAKVPACATCHGPDAKGNGAFPRLAGQLNEYVTRKLTNWEKERGQDLAVPDKSAAIMQPVAHSLTETQVAAVAAYLANLD